MISNVKVYGLEESIKRSKYPMSTDVTVLTEDVTNTVCMLGRSDSGEGHDQFLTGIIVQFDLRAPLKIWTELQRYHFIDFVSSQSTMHRIARLDIDVQCNEYVTFEAKQNLRRLVQEYKADQSNENYLRCLYNIPSGFELTAGMTTNYRQLKTIYFQRRYHRLPEWRVFCEWIQTLPMFKTLILGEDNDRD